MVSKPMQAETKGMQVKGVHPSLIFPEQRNWMTNVPVHQSTLLLTQIMFVRQFR